jgi:lysyl oxidase
MHRALASPLVDVVVRFSGLSLLCLAAMSATPHVVWATKPVPICTPQIPCADPRGCPDLTIDPGILQSAFIDIHTFAATDCSVVDGEATAGTRKMLLFSTITNNIGPGALFLGNPADHPDWFDLDPCENEYHIKDYADYRLWTVAGYNQWKALRAANPTLCAQQVFDANPDLATQVIRGKKEGFCFWDTVMMGQARLSTVVCPRTPDPQTYVSCDYAGLSVCWADDYDPIYGFTNGQWIDVTDVPNGYYVLENESNAKRLITEADYTNNSAAALIHLVNRNVKYINSM